MAFMNAEITCLRAHVFHHENNVGTLVAEITFNADPVWSGPAGAELAYVMTTSDPGLDWREGIPSIKRGEPTRDTRPGDRILLDYSDGTNDMFTVQAEPDGTISFYHGAK